MGVQQLYISPYNLGTKISKYKTCEKMRNALDIATSLRGPIDFIISHQHFAKYLPPEATRKSVLITRFHGLWVDYLNAVKLLTTKVVDRSFNRRLMSSIPPLLETILWHCIATLASCDLHFAELVSLNRSSVITYISRYVMKRVHQVFHVDNHRRSHVVVYNGIDDVFLKHTRDIGHNKTFNITYLGGGNPIKGSTLLLFEFRRFLKQVTPLENSKIKLFFVCNDKYLQYLQRLSSKLNLTQQVIFIQRLDHTRLASLFDQSSLVVVPSIIEGLGNVVLEAMSSGCPVLASRVGGIPEIIIDEKIGLLFDPSISGDLSRQLFICFKRRNYLERIGQAAQIYVRKKFGGWDRVASELTLAFSRIDDISISHEKLNTYSGCCLLSKSPAHF